MEAEAISQGKLLVDLIGPYKIRSKGNEETLLLKDLILIYPATGWFEILQYNYKHAARIEKLAEQTWLSRYL